MTVEPVGWILAAGFAALWWGERGRRIDAQLREGVVLSPPPKSSAIDPRTGAPVVEPPDELAEHVRVEQIMHDIMEETGVSEEAARAEAESYLAQMRGIGA